MRKAQGENVADYFNDGLVTVTNPGPLRGPIKRVKLRRNKKGGLKLTTITDGWSTDDREIYPAGTLRQSTDLIEFAHAGGGHAIARGVVLHGGRRRASNAKNAETIEKCSLDSIELDFLRG